MASGVAEVDVRLNLPDLSEVREKYGEHVETLLLTVFSAGVVSGQQMMGLGETMAFKAIQAGHEHALSGGSLDTLVNGSPENEGQDDAR